MANPAANELLPLVDAIRKGVYNRAMYLDVLQSPITLTSNLLGPNIAPLLPLAALSFLPEGEADSADEEEDEEVEVTNREREERGKHKKGKSGGASSRRSLSGANAEAEEEEKEKPKGTTSVASTRKKGRSSATPSPLPPVPIASAASAPGSAARTRRLATKRERVLPFLATVTRILKASRKESQQQCEEYYRAKGDRAATRPNRIPSSLPLLLQSLEETYTQHEQASVAHHTEAAKEFHSQLSTICSHLCNVPRTIFQMMTNTVLVQCRTQHEQMDSEFARKKNAWKLEREKLHNFIRPQVLSNWFNYISFSANLKKDVPSQLPCTT